MKLVAVLVIAGCGAAAAPPPKPAPVPSPPAPVVDSHSQQPPPVATRLDEVRPPPPGGAKPAALLDELSTELARSMAALAHEAEPPYFASYEVTDSHDIRIAASFGAIDHSTDSRHRALDIDVRVGNFKLDNTHRTRAHTLSASLPVEDDAYAARSVLWLETDRAYQRAAEQLQKVRASAGLKTAADDPSDDFSHEATGEYFEAPATIAIDRAAWETRLRALSAGFARYPDLVHAEVSLHATASTRYYASSDGTRYQLPSTHVRISISASTQATDGMQLHRFEAFDVERPDELPTDDQIAAKITRVGDDLVALRKAPVAEPYLGPAILEGKAASVFFHEVFGHRIEGHRQKDEGEGQTFAKQIGQRIMPELLSVYDDPTIARLNGRDLNGFYRYDDDGVPAQKALLVEHGVLRTFLLGRSPTRGFVHSNGHGRRSIGFSTVARQGNLIVAASRTVERAALQKQLIELVKQQGKPYGLVFRELDGGFTMTHRFSPQSFKLLPIMVYRVYVDGREELVRGADLDGTPLHALADIVAAADDADTFNGYCGAESGFVPVSSTSPSLLVARVEVSKKAKSSDKPPILPPPPRTGGGR